MGIGFTSNILPEPFLTPVHGDNPDFTPYEDEDEDDE